MGVNSWPIIIWAKLSSIPPPSKEGIGSIFAINRESETIDERYNSALIPERILVSKPKTVIFPIVWAALVGPVISFLASSAFPLKTLTSESIIETTLSLVCLNPSLRAEVNDPLPLRTTLFAQAKGNRLLPLYVNLIILLSLKSSISEPL